jgi:hypothetical protein
MKANIRALHQYNTRASQNDQGESHAGRGRGGVIVPCFDVGRREGDL